MTGALQALSDRMFAVLALRHISHNAIRPVLRRGLCRMFAPNPYGTDRVEELVGSRYD